MKKHLPGCNSDRDDRIYQFLASLISITGQPIDNKDLDDLILMLEDDEYYKHDVFSWEDRATKILTNI
jgi:hypothetical protein